MRFKAAASQGKLDNNKTISDIETLSIQAHLTSSKTISLTSMYPINTAFYYNPFNSRNLSKLPSISTNEVFKKSKNEEIFSRHRPLVTLEFTTRIGDTERSFVEAGVFRFLQVSGSKWKCVIGKPTNAINFCPQIRRKN
jgi:hypothetical protein